MRNDRAPYVLILLLLILIIGGLYLNRREWAADARNAKAEAIRAQDQIKAVQQRIDHRDLLITERDQRIATMECQLDSIKAARKPVTIIVNEALQTLADADLDSLRAVLMRRPE